MSELKDYCGAPVQVGDLLVDARGLYYRVREIDPMVARSGVAYCSLLRARGEGSAAMLRVDGCFLTDAVWLNGREYYQWRWQRDVASGEQARFAERRRQFEAHREKLRAAL